MICIWFGNILVTIVIAKTPSLHTVNGCFTVQLSIADISMGIFLALNAAINIDRLVLVYL